MRDLPSLNALRAFDAAARHLSFTRAAAELHVTHGAVSRQVAQLESALRRTLFIRGVRRLQLTSEGQVLAQGAGAAFDLLARAVRQATHAPATAPLRVSAPPTLAMWWLIPRLALLYEARPGLRLELSTSIEPAEFESGGYDAAIRRITRVPRGLAAERFLDARPVPVCSPAYQQRNRLHRVTDLERATLIATRSETRAWPEWLQRQGLWRKPGAGEIVFEQLYFALQAAIDGLGVALAPAALIGAEVERGRLCVLSAAEGPQTPSYALLWPKAAGHHDAIASLRIWLRREGLATPGRTP